MTDAPQASSSDDLRTDTANFLERADEVVAHPLAHAKMQLVITRELDPDSKRLMRVGFDMSNLPKEGWAYLATLMRPIVFSERDSLSFERLTSRLGHEHPTLADSLKKGRRAFVAWKRHRYMGLDVLPPTNVAVPCGDTPTITKMWLGEANTFPADLELTETVWDYEFADVFFNGCLWHSDRDKAARYEAASPALKQHILKCAEVRTLSAVRFVGSLRQFVLDARADGHEL